MRFHERRGGQMGRGLDLWQKWYDAGGQRVPVLTPGSDMTVSPRITVEHGGQSWFQIACGSEISDATNWTFLDRAQKIALLVICPAIQECMLGPMEEGEALRTMFLLPSHVRRTMQWGAGSGKLETPATTSITSADGRRSPSRSRSTKRLVGPQGQFAERHSPQDFPLLHHFKLAGAPAPTPP